MRSRRSLIDNSVPGAALALLLGARVGQPRRVALSRLQASLRPGRQSLAMFAGTPCSEEAAAVGPEPDLERPPDGPEGPSSQPGLPGRW